jgi:hypothetical protein
MIDPAFEDTNKPKQARLQQKHKRIPFWKLFFRKKSLKIDLNVDPRRN